MDYRLQTFDVQLAIDYGLLAAVLMNHFLTLKLECKTYSFKDLKEIMPFLSENETLTTLGNLRNWSLDRAYTESMDKTYPPVQVLHHDLAKGYYICSCGKCRDIKYYRTYQPQG